MSERESTRDALKEWLRADEGARQLVLQFLEDPDRDPAALIDYLREAAARKDAPAAASTLVTGGHVERIISIAQAGEVNVFLDRPADMRERRERLGGLLAMSLQADGGLPTVQSVEHS